MSSVQEKILRNWKQHGKLKKSRNVKVITLTSPIEATNKHTHISKFEPSQVDKQTDTQFEI